MKGVLLVFCYFDFNAKLLVLEGAVPCRTPLERHRLRNGQQLTLALTGKIQCMAAEMLEYFLAAFFFFPQIEKKAPRLSSLSDKISLASNLDGSMSKDFISCVFSSPFPFIRAL